MNSALKFGDHSDSVAEAQQHLWDMDLYQGRIDGIFGNRTRRAVEQFQSKRGLPVTGVIDVPTWHQIHLHSPGLAQSRAYTEVLIVGKTTVFQSENAGAFHYTSGLQIDADGAPNAYHPYGLGLDYIANAGRPGNWWGIATNADGNPYVQKNGPYAGYYVSTTTLQDSRKEVRDPARYVDSNKIPFVAIPLTLVRLGVKMGDVGICYNTQTNRWCPVIVVDQGPTDKIGEGSIALANAMGINSDPKRGGTDRKIITTLLFPGSGNKKPVGLDVLDNIAKPLFEAWGGLTRLKQVPV